MGGFPVAKRRTQFKGLVSLKLNRFAMSEARRDVCYVFHEKRAQHKASCRILFTRSARLGMNELM